LFRKLANITIFCNNFARWLQKIAACYVMWCVGFLECYYLLWQLCKMITKDSSMLWCDMLVSWDATIFCNKFARWLQKIVGPCCDVLVFWNATIFCDNFARWLQKIVATRPRNPRFKDAHTGTKLRLVDKTSSRDSGISGSGSNCDACVGFLRCYYLL
jgi:hypothetical protein